MAIGRNTIEMIKDLIEVWLSKRMLDIDAAYLTSKDESLTLRLAIKMKPGAKGTHISVKGGFNVSKIQDEMEADIDEDQLSLFEKLDAGVIDSITDTETGEIIYSKNKAGMENDEPYYPSSSNSEGI
jgi:hypothetical protein